MARAVVDGTTVAYELIGSGPLLVLTPGARYGKDDAGVRAFGAALAEQHTVLLWDRPNCGASDVRFDGLSESQMQADVLSELLRQLDLGPALLAGGSAGSRLSVITAIRHPDVVRALAVWWIVGGVYGPMMLASVYVLPLISTALAGGMEAVAARPDWDQMIAANPANRDRILSMTVAEFIGTMKRWLDAYVPSETFIIPGVSSQELSTITVPTLVVRSGSSDNSHPPAVAESVAGAIPNARIEDPPWGDDEWNDALRRVVSGAGLHFDRWHLLAPQILRFTTDV